MKSEFLQATVFQQPKADQLRSENSAVGKGPEVIYWSPSTLNLEGSPT